MGLGLSLTCQPPATGFLRKRRKDAGALSRSLHDDVLSLTELAPFSQILDRDDGGACVVLPIEEAVEFTDRGELVVVSAKTSSCGPGYHAFLIEQLEQLANLHSFDWHEQVLGDGDIHEDETGYFSDRSFDGLQEEMANLLRQFGKIVRDDDADGMMLQLSVGMGIDARQGHVAAPRGYFSRDQMSEIADASDDKLAAFASSYFPWWDFGLSDQARSGISEALLWCEFPWRSPLTDAERRLGEGVQSLLQLPSPSKTTGTLEQEALDELDRILNAGQAEVWPRPDGPGFHRGFMNWALTGRWELRAPGYGRFDFDESDSVATIDFNGGRVLATTYSIDRKGAFSAEAEIADKEGDICEVDDGLTYVATHEPYPSEDFDGFWLSGSVTGHSGFAVISILYEDPSLAAVAEKIFRSVHVVEDRASNFNQSDDDAQ